MAAQRPVMEPNSVRNPPAALSGSETMLDSRKTGATLLFSGGFLTFVGAIFTTVGWQNYLTNHIFEWTQLLGPIMLSVGVTFILISVCKLGIISYLPSRLWDEEALDQSSVGRSLTLSGVNQPAMLQSATPMICIPPAYNVINRDVCQSVEFLPGRSLNGVHAATPPHGSVYTAAGEDSSARRGEADCRRGRVVKTEDERRSDDDSSSTCSRPPAYEDIYPSFNKHNPT